MELQGYAATDMASRLPKARKIEALLGTPLTGKALLDLGAGSGILGAYFASRGAKVTAADRDDSRFQADLPFQPIVGPGLPFSDAQFDVVIFNHVLEHVGAAAAQAAMLDEIHRVLRPGGVLYLAVPNKWALIEPHFRLPLLGAMPRPLADLMARRFRARAAYDCYPPGYGALIGMLRSRFARVDDRCMEAIDWAIAQELNGRMRSAMRLIPRPVLRMLRPLYPTFVLLATK